MTEDVQEGPVSRLDIIDQHELIVHHGLNVCRCSCGRWEWCATVGTWEEIKSSWLAHIQRERDALRGEQ